LVICNASSLSAGAKVTPFASHSCSSSSASNRNSAAPAIRGRAVFDGAPQQLARLGRQLVGLIDDDGARSVRRAERGDRRAGCRGEQALEDLDAAARRDVDPAHGLRTGERPQRDGRRLAGAGRRLHDANALARVRGKPAFDGAPPKRIMRDLRDPRRRARSNVEPARFPQLCVLQFGGPPRARRRLVAAG
jgi:hypothetical protein